MSDLADFLRARLAEDAEVAQATRKNEQFVDGTDRWFASHGNAITSMAPHRAVADVEAKRRIVDEHPILTAHRVCTRCSDFAAERGELIRQVPGPCLTLRLLALPYDGHPDYLEEWHV